jgi:hypothetical protein
VTAVTLGGGCQGDNGVLERFVPSYPHRLGSTGA